MYKILIIEDAADLGTTQGAYLERELERLATKRSVLETVSRDPRTMRTYRDAHGELGQGSLHHLASAISTSINHGERLRFPEIGVLAPHELMALAPRAKVADVQARRKSLDEVLRADCWAGGPEILIVDLALFPNEGEAMEENGALDELSNTRREPVADPRKVLRELTGFRILEAYGADLPVIVTTSSCNPLVEQHCRLNGAFAVVIKPVPAVSLAGDQFDFATAFKNQFDVIELSAKNNDSPLDVLVMNYLTHTASEVLKAMTDLTCRLDPPRELV